MPIRPADSRLRRAGVVGLTGLLVAAGTVFTPLPAAAAPSYTLAERAAAIASPAMVFLEMAFTGYVRDEQTNNPILGSPVTISQRCSGFVVNPDGHVVSSGSCLLPETEVLQRSAVAAVGRKLIEQKRLDEAGLEAYVDRYRNSVRFTGKEPSAPPENQLYGQFNAALGGLTANPAVPADVVQIFEADQGSVALVRLRQSELPAVELSPVNDLQPGTQLVAMAYDAYTGGSTTTYAVQSAPVDIASARSQGLVPIYRLSAPIGSHARGGMLIDTAGRLVGMVENDYGRSDLEGRAAIQATAILALLRERGVGNKLSDADELYRSGLDDYFGGRYARAISAFETVVQKVSVNQSAERFRQNAIAYRQIEGESERPAWLIALLGAVAGALGTALAVAAGGALARRARRRPEGGIVTVAPPGGRLSGALPAWAPSIPISGAPMSGAPISGAPMSGAPISGAPISGAPISGAPASGPVRSSPPVSGYPQSSASPPSPHVPRARSGHDTVGSPDPRQETAASGTVEDEAGAADGRAR